MLNLLTAEKIKLMKSRKLWIVLGLLFILPIYQAVNTVVELNHGGDLDLRLDTVINGASGILMMDKNDATILLIISAFISFSIGEEFHNGTIRNALSLGRSRTEYYMAKLLTASLVTFIGAAIMTVVGMIGYGTQFGFGTVGDIENYVSYAYWSYVTLFLLILANVSVYVMISFMTRSSSIAIIWGFLYTMGTGFGPSIFQQTEHFKELTYWFVDTFLFYFTFASQADMTEYLRMIIVSLITIVLSSILGIYIFKRTDIK